MALEGLSMSEITPATNSDPKLHLERAARQMPAKCGRKVSLTRHKRRIRANSEGDEKLSPFEGSDVGAELGSYFPRIANSFMNIHLVAEKREKSSDTLPLCRGSPECADIWRNFLMEREA